MANLNGVSVATCGLSPGGTRANPTQRTDRICGRKPRLIISSGYIRLLECLCQFATLTRQLMGRYIEVLQLTRRSGSDPSADFVGLTCQEKRGVAQALTVVLCNLKSIRCSSPVSECSVRVSQASYELLWLSASLTAAMTWSWTAAGAATTPLLSRNVRPTLKSKALP